VQALAEEAKAHAAFFGDAGLVVAGPTISKSAVATIEDVRSSGNPTNWALFQVA
jgi:hypothetical protein